jgi:Fungal Zn(2)-Cys(6) binuclear cluster domain
MWEPITKEMGIPWRLVEAMHWQLGEAEMASRANAPIFHSWQPPPEKKKKEAISSGKRSKRAFSADSDGNESRKRPRLDTGSSSAAHTALVNDPKFGLSSPSAIDTKDKTPQQRKLEACNPCKRRKIRCDESKPSCHHCSTLNISCEYPEPEPKFPCTFCHKMINWKSWKRHEESTHLPRVKWPCSPAMHPANYFPNQGGEVDPHRFRECADKPVDDRTFLRKDKLVQHWRIYHHLELSNDRAEQWKVIVDYSHHRWSCGFCGEKLKDWDTRASHLGKHFREGLTMEQWNSEKCLEREELELFAMFTNGGSL